MDTRNLAIVRQSFANTVFTHKVQEVAAESTGNLATKIKIANVVTVAVALIMLLFQVANPSNLVFSYIGSGVAAGEVVFLIIQLTFSFEKASLAHKNSALKYMQLRDKYRGLITDIMNDQNPEAFISRRDALQAEYQVISDLAPQTGTKEYIEAQKRLHTSGASGGEHYTWSETEIDQFLPGELKLGA